ncbi:hypothetical protein [Oryza sativa Japonica Group]|uniref:Uncharacterized protein n=2 Tax=Oryza sativa subsp. japonica TaxID=39947 RepID=Q5N9M6_ORYSJ|nr:hypothetical protein [Oryza sativa Japonica Group]BAD82659.1 hypothetical protein [Oryza sativa Japonica Group]
MRAPPLLLTPAARQAPHPPLPPSNRHTPPGAASATSSTSTPSRERCSSRRPRPSWRPPTCLLSSAPRLRRPPHRPLTSTASSPRAAARRAIPSPWAEEMGPTTRAQLLPHYLCPPAPTHTQLLPSLPPPNRPWREEERGREVERRGEEEANMRGPRWVSCHIGQNLSQNHRGI